MYMGGSGARRARALCKNSNIKGASFFCASGAGWRCRLPCGPAKKLCESVGQNLFTPSLPLTRG